MITVTQSISGKYFSANVPDLVFTIGGTWARVTMSVDGDEIYSEPLYPVDGQITVSDLASMLTPYAKRKLVLSLTTVIEEVYDDSRATTPVDMSAEIVFSMADVSTTCADFVENHFLSILAGHRTTAEGRLEYLHYIGTDNATVTAVYDDQSERNFTLLPVGGNAKYTTIDVSPSQFLLPDKRLARYEVRAGNRLQVFVMDFANPDCAPVLIFENSFGVEELLYCTGTHKIAPRYKRETIYIKNLKKNYEIEETRPMTADTGIMTHEQAMWAEELFRSQYVRVVNFHGGEPRMGKEVVITDAKAERTNDDGELPRFTFTYEYAQRNHNILDLQREGRIFDNTFDHTFN